MTRPPVGLSREQDLGGGDELTGDGSAALLAARQVFLDWSSDDHVGLFEAEWVEKRVDLSLELELVEWSAILRDQLSATHRCKYTSFRWQRRKAREE